MASRTPPRPTVDRIDIRGTPTPSRTRPSYIPLPSSLSSAPPSAASALMSSASNGNINGNGVVRSGSSLQYQRPSESSISRASLDDSRAARSSSLSVNARTSSPGPGTHLQAPSSSLLRSSLVGLSENHSIVALNGMAQQKTHSRTNSTANSESRSRSSSRNAPGLADALGEHSGYSISNGTQSTIVADDCDDGERILPVKVAVRVRPLLVGSSSPADSAIGGAGSSRHMQPRSNLANCLEVLQNATIAVSAAASAAPGNLGVTQGPLSYHGAAIGGIGDDVFGPARHSIANGSALGGAASSANGIANTASSAPRTFKFDYAFGPDSQQPSVYETAISPLLNRFVEGYNVTVLAYGQTSSGKTYTMGTDADDVSLLSQCDAVSDTTGIVPRSLGWLFDWVAQQQQSPNSASDADPRSSLEIRQGVDIRVSFLEVYNEELIDLVALTQYRGVRPPIFIREDTKGNIIWTGVKEMPVSDARGALDILVSGSQERQTGGTQMNEKSSRSHAIYSIILTQTRMRTRSGSVAADGTVSAVREPVKIVSKLHFVDLAGSERLKKTMAVGERQREGISINSGLLALGNVISALGDTQRGSLSFVPYRDSKLTHMLRDSLGGNAQTLLIACVSAAEANLTETVNTLKYASRARNIKNRGGVNMVTMGRVSAKEVESLRAMVRKLKGEVRVLNEKLQALDMPSRDSILNGSAANLPMLSQPTGGGSTSRLSFIGTPLRSTNGDPSMPETPSKIPSMSAALQKRAQTAEELNILKARNLTLESELEQLNDTYTELLLKFNDACREIEEKQSESFQRDQRLRDREQEIRRLTAHSRHERRVVSSIAESGDGASIAGGTRPTSVADTLRMKRRSARISRSISELERSDATGDRVQSIAEEDDSAPPMPDMTRLRDLRSTSAVSSARTSQINADGVAVSEKLAAALGEPGVAPGEAEFDAILEEYDANVRTLEEELKTAHETVEGLKLQLSMQETKATFAEKLNASQLAQIETMREQLAKAREAGMEEEERRRAVEAELEEANFNAETHLESVINEWRLEMQHVDEQWADRWEAAQLEHQKEVAEQREEIEQLRNSVKHSSGSSETKNLQLLSPPPTAHDIQSEQKYQLPQQQYTAEREENERLNARIRQLEEALDNSVSRAHSLEADVETLTNQSLDAEARASSAEDALSALSAKMSLDPKEDSGFGSGPLSPPILPSYSRSYSDLPRRTSNKIMLCARNSMAVKTETGANSNEAAQASLTEATNGVSPSEQRLRNMRSHRYSTAVPVHAMVNGGLTSMDASADKYASYPELRLMSSQQHTREYGFGSNGRPLPIYDEDQIQKMLQDAVAEVDKEAWYEKDRDQMVATVESLKETKKALQERNSQLQNLLRDLGDRLVGLAEENDLLEAKLTEHDSLTQEVNRLTGVVSSHERTIRDLQREARSCTPATKPSRPQSLLVPRHTVTDSNETPASGRESAPPSLEKLSKALGGSRDTDAPSYELSQLQSQLSMVEAELTEALLASNEHQSNADMLMQQVDEYRERIKDVETDVESLMVELDAKTKENQQLSTVLQKQKKDADGEIESHKKLVSVLRESLAADEQHMEEAKLASDRYSNELVRVQAEVKKLEVQLDDLRQQLDDARGISMSEARDRDIWKSRCQDLREEVEELRTRRRQSKIRCF
ncbi:hypothetical protein LPJ59_001090 [Coemansia sp. RSA 2399]|nr:hypothetical protein LPJ59_001090 [Coemansia sp. RSA 2399]